MQTEWILLSDIESGDRKRPLSQRHVDQLAESIREIGLQTPITVMARMDEDGWRSILVAGAHRLAALRKLGKDGADCFVLPDDDQAAELWEIDENLMRDELTDVQRARALSRRKELMEARGLVRAVGRPNKSTQNVGIKSYADEAAETLGVSAETVRRDLRRVEDIDADVLDVVEGTSVDKGVHLDALRKTPRPQQMAKAREIEAANKEACAANRAADKAIQHQANEQWAEWIVRRSDLNELDSIIAMIEASTTKGTIAAVRRLTA